MDTTNESGAATPRLGVDSPARRPSMAADLPLTFSPTSDAEVTHTLPLSTSDMDALRTSYFTNDNNEARPSRPRSMSNPDPSAFLAADISQNSRLAEVSEAETEGFGDINRSGTRLRGRSRRKQKLGRTMSDRMMSRGEEELIPDWTVFGELFEGQHAPIISKNSLEGSTKRSATTASTSIPDSSGVGRTTSSVIRHWKNVTTNSRLNRATIDEERGEPIASSSSAQTNQPVDIISRIRSSRVPNNGSTGSPPAMTVSPKTNHISEELSSPMRPALDGEEENLDHHRSSVDYERRGQFTRKQSKCSDSSTDSSLDTDSDPGSPEAYHNSRFYTKLIPFIKRWKAEIPPLTTLHRNMLKCSIAYFLASLFTFVPFLSKFISDISTFGNARGLPNQTVHMIATVCVGFPLR
jgi:hypothetical protein